ncbi:unnamed protein product [Ceutorhynchus assimilis]|uniref:Uncharacterized protein n=1 Tax=Ceutorhynchus assimilis TaxID=467358 RepID=A0A9N9QMD2_9CUCU|nr:unnamed protein product [Ceutorhynchus assimilis]
MGDFVNQRIPTADKDDLTNRISWFSTQIALRWKRCHRNKIYFLNKHEIWLNEFVYKSKCQSTFQRHAEKPSRKNTREFSDVSARTRRRRTQELVSHHSPAELAFATQSGYTKRGKRNVAFVIKKDASTGENGRISLLNLPN